MPKRKLNREEEEAGEDHERAGRHDGRRTAAAALRSLIDARRDGGAARGGDGRDGRDAGARRCRGRALAVGERGRQGGGPSALRRGRDEGGGVVRQLADRALGLVPGAGLATLDVDANGQRDVAFAGLEGRPRVAIARDVGEAANTVVDVFACGMAPSACTSI
jgi:hypothetical protein